MQTSTETARTFQPISFCGITVEASGNAMIFHKAYREPRRHVLSVNPGNARALAAALLKAADACEMLPAGFDGPDDALTRLMGEFGYAPNDPLTLTACRRLADLLTIERAKATGAAS